MRSFLNQPVLVGFMVAAIGIVSASAPTSRNTNSISKDGSKSRRDVMGLSSLPQDAQASISAALGRDLRVYQVRAQGAGFRAENAQQGLAADFTAAGVEVRSGRWHIAMALLGYGYGNALHVVNAAAPSASLNRVEYQRRGMTEWYADGPLGLEQGFTFSGMPQGRSGGQPLTIALAISGDLGATVEQGRTGLTLSDSQKQPQLRYAGLTAYDATGKKLHAWMELQGGQLLLNADDTGARYPVVIDPVVQLAKLTASDGATNNSLGYSVAISGNTIVAAAPYAVGYKGAIYVFVKPANGWANMTQTAKLTASDGAAFDSLGFSVAIRGNTIVGGAPQATIGSNAAQGAAYVFVKPASGWVNGTEKYKLIASDGATNDQLGYSVSVSGNTAVAGAPQATISNGYQGAAYVFVHIKSSAAGSRTTIMTQTAKLIASDGGYRDNLGWSVSISGNALVAGSPQTGSAGVGAAYVFVKPASGWANGTQTAKLTTFEGSGGVYFGYSVSISGNTVVSGAPYTTIGANQYQGAAYVFVKPAKGWANMTETATLTASDGAAGDLLGYSISVSGKKAVAGAPYQPGGGSLGAVYVFVKPRGGWVNGTETAKVTASDGVDGDKFGWSVAISYKTFVGGSPYATIGSNQYQGAAYVFGKQ